MVRANYINKINKQIIFAIALVIVLLNIMVEAINLNNYTKLLQNIEISTKKIEAYSFKPEVFQYNKFKLVFGENYELDNKAVKQPSNKELPVAKRDLVLKGILSNLGAGNKNLGSVIISFKGQTKIYFIGDHIPGGGYLYGINNDHIIIKTNNNLEKLCLQDKLSLTP
jgi:type II secretory pathway component PulC